MGLNVAQKLIRSHLADGEMTPGTEIGLRRPSCQRAVLPGARQVKHGQAAAGLRRARRARS